MSVSCAVRSPSSDGIVAGHVIASTPVRGAHVSIWQLTPEGERFELVGEATTDENGWFSTHVGQAWEGLLIEATGGTTTELWAPDVDIRLEQDLRAVLTDYEPGAPGTVRLITVSPLTTLAEALGRSRLARGDKEEIYDDAMERASELLGTHFGNINLTDTPAVRISIPATELRDGVRHGFVIAGLAGLAQWIAEEANTSAAAVNTLTLTAMLVEDASDLGAHFDGEGPDGPIRVAGCPRTPECEADPAVCEPTACDLNANTLRGGLATGLAFYIVPSELNGTGLTFEDVRPLIEGIWMRDEDELFGDEPPGPLGGELPATVVGITSVDDEWTDVVTFSPGAVPSFAPTGPATWLDGYGPCEAQTVRKYVTRMDNPSDNPLRWTFSVQDRRGAAIEPDSGEYRVGLRSPDGVDWLTDWVPATQVPATRPDAVDYEAVLLRSDVPALATERGIFEIAFRGKDTLGQWTLEARSCWENVPLAAPLWVSPAKDVPAADDRSLYGVHLGDGLAPLLNGVAMNEGKGIMEFEIRNGTTEPVYVTLNLEQPSARYTKSWQKTNAFLRDDLEPSSCLRTGTCVADFPPERSTTAVIDEIGFVPRMVTALSIWDVGTGQPLLPCVECDAGEYRIEPRSDENNPRIYRLMAMVTDLGPVAPEPGGEDWGPFADTVLDPIELPTLITGRTFEQIIRCTLPDWATSTCERHEIYRHYLALSAVTLSVDWLRVRGRTSPTATLDPLLPAEQSNTLGIPVEYVPTSWTDIANLPPAKP